MPSTCRIKIERSGGFAGITRGGQLNRDDLSPTEATELTELLNAVDLSKYQTTTATSGQPDRFRYHLLIECGTPSYDINVGEQEMDAPLKRLVDWLMHRV